LLPKRRRRGRGRIRAEEDFTRKPGRMGRGLILEVSPLCRKSAVTELVAFEALDLIGKTPNLEPQRSSTGRQSSSAPASDDDIEDCEEGQSLHAIRPGVLLCDRFRVRGRLGTGAFATVWLCADEEQEEDNFGYVALKVYRAVDRYQLYASEESGLLRDAAELAESRPPSLVGLLGLFPHQGPACQHACVALELLGPSALEMAERSRSSRLPLPLLCCALRGGLRALDFLHRECSIIHTDVKPENILINIPPGSAMFDIMRKLPFGRAERLRLMEAALREGASATFSLVDLGNSCTRDRHVSVDITTMEYKAVEVMLNAGYDTGADIWSLACTVYELATGRYLFDPRRSFARPQALPARPALANGPEHVAQIVELLGPLPSSLLGRSRRLGAFFRTTAGGLLESATWPFQSPDGSEVATSMSTLPRCALIGRLAEHLPEEPSKLLAQVLSPMLQAPGLGV
ncbi:unnamed protein product, partial [Symbiodinium microadriaticum]